MCNRGDTNQFVLRTRLFRAQNLNDLLPKINLFLLVALSYDRTTVFQICTHIFKCQMQILHFSNFDLRSIHRPVVSGVGRPPLFDRSVNPISTRRAHYSHPVLRAPPRIFRPCEGPDTYHHIVPRNKITWRPFCMFMPGVWIL